MASWTWSEKSKTGGQIGRVIENVIEIMRMLCNDDAKTLKEFSAATGLTPKTCWRYMQVFKKKMKIQEIKRRPYESRFWIE